MSAFTDVLAAHSRVRHPRAETDFALMCACGWETIVTLDEIEYEPDRYLDAEPILLARHAAHVEVELAKAGIVITQLPARSGDPFRARDIVIRAAKMREKDQRDKGVKKPFEWWQCTDAQKVHWILAAAASIPTKETPK